MTNITKALDELETATSFSSKSARDNHAKNIAALRAALQDKSGAVRGYEPAGFLLHWPAPGGGRQTIWSETRAPGLAIGCPVTEVFKASVVAE